MYPAVDYLLATTSHDRSVHDTIQSVLPTISYEDLTDRVSQPAPTPDWSGAATDRVGQPAPTPDWSGAATACLAGSLEWGAPRPGTARPLCPPCRGMPTFPRRTVALPRTPSGLPGTCNINNKGHQRFTIQWAELAGSLYYHCGYTD